VRSRPKGGLRHHLTRLLSEFRNPYTVVIGRALTRRRTHLSIA